MQMTKVSATFARSSSAYLPDGSSVSSGAPRYVTESGDVGVMVERGTTNLAPNPLLADSNNDNQPDSWLIIDPPGGSHSLDTTKTWGDRPTWKFVHPVHTSYYGLSGPTISFDRTKNYTVSVLVACEGAGTTNLRRPLWLHLHRADGTITKDLGFIDDPGGTHDFQWLTFTIPANSAPDDAVTLAFVRPSWRAGGTFWVAAVQVEQKAYRTSFIDGTRSDELLSVPRPAGLTPSEGTIEVDVFINSLARRQVSGENPIIIDMSVAGSWVGGALRLYHLANSAFFRIGTSDDSGTITTADIPDSALPDGLHRVRIAGNLSSVRVYVDANPTPVATITNPKLPTAWPSTIYLGGYTSVNKLNSSIHGLEIWGIDRGSEGLRGAKMPMVVDVNTLGLWLFDGTLAATWAIPENRQVHTRFRVGRSDGVTWVDLADYLVHAVVELGNVDAVGTENAGVDGVARMLTFTLKQQGSASFSPRVQNSPWNQFGGVYDPLLAPNREVYLAVAFTAPGGTPAEEDYVELFRGLLGSRITLDGPTMGRIRCIAFDRTRILQRCFIEQVRQYGSEAGTCTENDIVQIMEDNLGSRAPLLVVDNEGAENALVNSSFEDDTDLDGLADNWTQTGTGTPSLVESPVWDGARAQRLAVAFGDTCSISQQVQATAGQGQGYMFRLAIQAAAVEPEASINLQLKFRDSISGLILGAQAITIRAAHTGMVQRAVFSVAPAGTVIVEASVEIAGGGIIVIDAAELRTCSLSGKMNKPYSIELQSVRDAIHIHAKQTGWFLGYRQHVPAGTYTAAGWHLKFMEPPRFKDAGTADFDLSHLTDFYRQDLDISDDGVRNAVYVTYKDSASGERRTILREDAESIAAHGRLACWFEESDTSLIDTDDEAADLALVALADLKDFLGTTRLDMPLLPELDTFAGVTVAHPAVSSTRDFYGIISVRHELNWERGQFRTEAIGVGKVVGAYRRWLSMETRPGAQPVAPLPISMVIPPDPEDVTVAEIGWFGLDGVYISGILVTFKRPDFKYYKEALVSISSDNGKTWRVIGSTISSSYQIDPLQAGVEYIVKVQSVSSYGTQSPGSLSVPITLIGDTEAPPMPVAYLHTTPQGLLLEVVGQVI